jgi:hypothetical protein
MKKNLEPRKTKFWSSLIHFIFFGNYFYGICAVALSIEAGLQQRFPLNSILYYSLIFLATVIFYTKAYLSENTMANSNPRSQWYAANQVFVQSSQFIYILLCISIIIYIAIQYKPTILNLNATEWILGLSFPSVALLYYGIDNKSQKIFSLRNIGWLKPFVIGLVWAGLVTIYPILYFSIIHNTHFELTQIGILLFIKNLMFVTMLCVLFDIKDFASDSNQQLKTFVVKAGLRKTIFSFVIPLSILGWGSFVFYGIMHHFHPVKILLNTIPFLLLVLIAYSLHRPKSILYYLILIDGLMLIKAIFGSLAMIYF